MVTNKTKKKQKTKDFLFDSIVTHLIGTRVTTKYKEGYCECKFVLRRSLL